MTARRTLRWGAVLIAAGHLACATPPGPLPQSDRMQILREVGAVQDTLQAVIERLDATAYLGLLAPPVEFRFARDGQLVPGLHDEVPRAFARVGSMTCTWPDRTITVLSRDAATITVTYRCTGQNKDGVAWTGAGAWTSVVQRRGDRWIIVEAHESHPAAPAP